MSKEQLALRIRSFRKLKGYTQNELAEALGVSIAILGSLERGTRKLDKKMLSKICSVLGIEPDELIGQAIK